MNTILLKNDYISFENEIVSINILCENLTMNIKGHVVINEIVNENILKKLDIIIEENSILEYNRFSDLKENELDINVNINNNGKFYGKMAFICRNKNKINILTKMNGSNIENVLYIKAISKDEGNVYINVLGDVIKNTINNKLHEEIRILNLNDSKNEIVPSMLVSSNEVQADHFVTMASIPKEELFYLSSKGIDNNRANELIENGFILDIFTDEFRKNICNKEV